MYPLRSWCQSILRPEGYQETPQFIYNYDWRWWLFVYSQPRMEQTIFMFMCTFKFPRCGINKVQSDLIYICYQWKGCTSRHMIKFGHQYSFSLKLSQKSPIAAQKKAWLSWNVQLGSDEGKVSMILEIDLHPNWHTYIYAINSWSASFLNTLLSSSQLFPLLFILTFLL